MKFSIITACFNAAATVEQTLQSVLSQSGVELEYIVIDGGSTDGTAEIIRRYEDRLAHFVSEPDGGQVEALNKGFTRATGEVLSFLNADDFYQPDALASVATAFSAAPKCDLVYGKVQWIDWEGRPEGIHQGGIENLDDALDIYRVWWANQQYVQPEVFFRRSLKERVGAFDARYNLAFDYDFWVRCFRAQARPVRLDQVLVNFRRHAQQKSTAFAQANEEIRAIMRRHLAERAAIGVWRRLQLNAQLDYDCYQSTPPAARPSFAKALARHPQWIFSLLARQRLFSAFNRSRSPEPANLPR